MFWIPVLATSYTFWTSDHNGDSQAAHHSQDIIAIFGEKDTRDTIRQGHRPVAYLKESVNHVSECLVNSAAGTAIRNKGSFPILSPPDTWVRSPTCYFPGKIKSAKEQATSIHSLATHTHWDNDLHISWLLPNFLDTLGLISLCAAGMSFSTMRTFQTPWSLSL